MRRLVVSFKCVGDSLTLTVLVNQNLHIHYPRDGTPKYTKRYVLTFEFLHRQGEDNYFLTRLRAVQRREIDIDREGKKNIRENKNKKKEKKKISSLWVNEDEMRSRGLEGSRVLLYRDDLRVDFLWFPFSSDSGQAHGSGHSESELQEAISFSVFLNRVMLLD